MINDAAENDFEKEEQNAEELAAEQEFYAAQAEAEELHNEGQRFKHPSYFKYFVLLAPLATIADLVDLADLTGFGIPLGRSFSFAASSAIILIFWFTNTKQKQADEYIETIEKKIELITSRIAAAEKNIVRVARLSRHVPGAKRIYRKLHLKTIRKARVALRGVTKSAKSPIIRSLAAGTLNLVPFLSLIPWMLVGIWLSYRAEKESYKNARMTSELVLETADEAVAT